MKRNFIAISTLCFAMLLHAQPAYVEAAENTQQSTSEHIDEAKHSPRTNAERRREGVPYEVAPWFTVSTIVDMEWRGEEFAVENGGYDSTQGRSATFQLGLTVTPWEYLKGEIILEYDTAISSWQTDEAFIAIELQEWELQAGRLYTPLGEYISHFPSGPILEFGETSSDGVSLTYDSGQMLEINVTAYSGHASEVSSHASGTDWSVAVAANLENRFLFGLSYQSDLADANSTLLADSDNRFQRKVDAVSGYFIWSHKEFELSFELLGALDSFHELGSDRDRPLAWNLELARFESPDWEWALRIEGSHELEDEPEWQVGAALTWHVSQNISCSVEYLHGHFADGFATNQADQPYDQVDRVGAQISLGF